MRLKGTTGPDISEGGGAPSGQWELAYHELDLSRGADREYLDGVVAMGQQPAADSWRWYEEIGEVRYAINRAARVAGYMAPYAEYTNARGEVTRNDKDSPTVQTIVNDITSRFGGTRGLVQRYYALMKIPGEAVLVRFKDGDDYDGYWFLSPDEIERQALDANNTKSTNQPITWKTARHVRTGVGTNPFTREVAVEDVLGRVWMPSFRYADECDSPMMAVNPLCEMLNDLTNSIKARIRNRFASNGMLLVPSGMNDVGVGGGMPETLMYSNNKVLNAIIHILTTNMVKYGSAAVDRLPIALMGPSDELASLRHMIFDSKIDEVDLKLRVELIGRILEGLDQQKAATRDGADQSHWGAWATDEAERRITVEPDLQQLDHLLTRMVLHRRLKDLEWDDSRILGWRMRHKLNEAMIRVNQAEDFRQAFDRGEIGPAALRRATGAEATDEPSAEERVRMLGWKMNNPILAFYNLKGIEAVPYDEAILWTKSSKGPDAQGQGDPTQEGPGVSDPGSPNDRNADAPKSQEPG